MARPLYKLETLVEVKQGSETHQGVVTAQIIRAENAFSYTVEGLEEEVLEASVTGAFRRMKARDAAKTPRVPKEKKSKSSSARA